MTERTSNSKKMSVILIIRPIDFGVSIKQLPHPFPFVIRNVAGRPFVYLPQNSVQFLSHSLARRGEGNGGAALQIQA